MYEFDTKRLKFLGLLILLLLAFGFFVGNAYKYIPEQNESANYSEEKYVPEISEYSNEKQGENIEISSEESVAEQKLEQNSGQVLAENSDFKQAILETLNIGEGEAAIPIDNSANQKSERISSEDLFSKVNELKKQQNYQEAIIELKRILETSNDDVNKSNCYEEMAIIYGIDKHYGTALVYAQKAYNLYPTTNREVLLARLYYKTGDTERATNRINNVLQRDFWADR